MSAMSGPINLQRRATELFDEHLVSIQKRTDSWFSGLMTVQFAAGVLFAVVISPHTWSGAMSRIHVHVWAAILIGGLITSLPVAMALRLPGRPVTRYVVASAQMLTSALLIHLTGGRIETHFHVFGSLAFLSFYRDWRVFIPATFVVGVDHLVRGMFWPQSVYGVLYATPWRSLEHAAWVFFEEIFLIRACFLSVREMRQIAANQADLEFVNAEVEEKVSQRTIELNERTVALEQEIKERERAEQEREELHRRMMEISHQAGMAEVATGVLHNVGNVLNSVNVSAALATDAARRADTASLRQIADMLGAQNGGLGAFLTDDPRGRLVPRFMDELARQMAAEQETVVNELGALNKSVNHIREIVAMQQSNAKGAGIVERVTIASVIECALDINRAGFGKHGIEVVRDYGDEVTMLVEKHKLLQILVNLLSNARNALIASPRNDRRLTLRVREKEDASPKVIIEVEDNGIGIPSENLVRIFGHGFTTRADGHGFGLHSAALDAKIMRGALSARSDGAGWGAVFTLELPWVKEEVPA